MYGNDIPRFEDVKLATRQRCLAGFSGGITASVLNEVFSYKRVQGVMGNICVVANCYWSRVLEEDLAAICPRILYRIKQHRAMNAVKREHGLGVRQVEAISMQEAQSGGNFADAYCKA